MAVLTAEAAVEGWQRRPHLTEVLVAMLLPVLAGTNRRELATRAVQSIGRKRRRSMCGSLRRGQAKQSGGGACGVHELGKERAVPCCRQRLLCPSLRPQLQTRKGPPCATLLNHHQNQASRQLACCVNSMHLAALLVSSGCWVKTAMLVLHPA